MIPRLRSPRQLMPFATAGELLEAKRRPLVSISSGATAVGALRVMERHDVEQERVTLLFPYPSSY